MYHHILTTHHLSRRKAPVCHLCNSQLPCKHYKFQEVVNIDKDIAVLDTIHEKNNAKLRRLNSNFENKHS